MIAEKSLHVEWEQPLEAGKGKGIDPPLELSEGIQFCTHLDFISEDSF